MAKRKLKKGRRKVVLALIVLTFFLLIIYGATSLLGKVFDGPGQTRYTSNMGEPIILINDKFKEVDKTYRGEEVKMYGDKIKDSKNNIYVKIQYNGKKLYINTINLVSNKKEIVKEDKVYVRTPSTIYSNVENGSIQSFAKKGEELLVVDYDNVNKEGQVNVYKVKIGEQQGYVYGKYVLTNKDEALNNYDPAKYYDVHNARGNRFGGGYAGNLDYYPVDKPKFKDNIIPDKVYALYLNTGVLKRVDEYIEYAKTTKINAFVVDIKDDDSIGYKSQVLEQYSKTNNSKANNSFETYKSAIKKIKDAGFYVIGRITAFKDKYYCVDNPGDAILNTQTGEPYLHNDTYWPSPYQRSVWEYNVNLAKEAVKEMGFNEIQFDYVRFTDKTGDDEKSGLIDFRNEYGEEKAQAIQGFVRYAVDELHKLNVYVSVDVFGESAYTYVTAYGQYWAAISNVVDVISGMPYPDHFNKYEFDFTEPVWTKPYELLNLWASKYVVKRQQEIPTPAIARTWIAVFDAKGGSYPYGVSQIDSEIRGLVDAGLTGGYMTWLSTSNLDKYKSQKEVYDKEY